MIEYDKANVTSSYPSLTTYEVETILDKAYLALIAQKVTGNNPRKAGFESDIKSIHDLLGLIQIDNCPITERSNNECFFDIPPMLYYIESYIQKNLQNTQNVISGMDNINHNKENVELINRMQVDKFRCTSSNMPWIETPVAYLSEDQVMCVFVDPMKCTNYDNSQLCVTSIKRPTKFAGNQNSDNTPFELSDTMAEELINLAIVFATENVESPRLQTKSSILTLES